MNTAAITPGGKRREWQRFSPLTRLSRFGFYLFTIAAVVVSLRTIDVIPEFLYDAPDQMVDLASRMWPPSCATQTSSPSFRSSGSAHPGRPQPYAIATGF